MNKIIFDLKYLDTLNELAELIIHKENCESSVHDGLKEAMLAIGIPRENIILSLMEILKTNRSQVNEFERLFKRWLRTKIVVLGDIARSTNSFSKVKYEFIMLMNEIKGKSLEALVYQAFGCLGNIKETNPELYNLLTVGYQGWYFEDNWLDGFEGNNNSLIYNRLATLKNNYEKIIWLHDNLCDEESKESLNAVLKSWLYFNMNDAFNITSWGQDVVVNRKIFSIYEDEVFIDCGSYTGDTVLELITETCGKYNKVYTYDISENTVEQMKKNLENYKNIVYNVKGVSNENGYLSFSGVDAPFHGNKLTKDEGSSVKVPIVKLDDDIKEPITFLKIDVEGLDKEALQGAEMHVKTTHPKIHVDTYHKLVDFFEVPLLINKIDPTYKFYLRLINNRENPTWFCITCIYAV